MTNKNNNNFNNIVAKALQDDNMEHILNNKFNDLSNNTFVQEIFNNYSNPYYIHIYNILKNENLSNYNKQEQIENIIDFQIKKLILDIFKNKQKLLATGNYNLEIINIIHNMDRDLTDLKNSKLYLKNKVFKNEFKNLLNVDIIYILLKNIIPHCILQGNDDKQNITNLLIKIGTELYKTYLKNILNKNNEDNLITSDSNTKVEDNKLNYVVVESNDNKVIEDYNKDILFYLDLGSSLVEYIGLNTNLYKIVTIKIKDNKSNRIIIPGKDLSNKIAFNFGFSNNELPMITPPEKWVIEINNEDIINTKTNTGLNNNIKSNYQIINYGGYIKNKKVLNKNSFIHNNHKNYGVNKLLNDSIVNTINYLSNIKLTVNLQMLHFIINLLKNKDIRIIKLINWELHPNTSKLFNLQLGGLVNKHFIKNIQKHNSKFYQDISILYFALIYSFFGTKELTFYLPYFMDFRGRLYPKTGYISPQGSELSRSLIIFKDKIKVTKNGLVSLKIYTANCFGLNKKSKNNRIEWVDNNLNSIINLELDFIFKAKEPLLFLSCCIELNNYFKDPENYESGLPIYMDATCSGLQHLSTMIKDENLANLVNLTESSNVDTPLDLYDIMAKRVIKKIDELPVDDVDKTLFNSIIINRDFVKTGIMTIPYGATILGLSDQLKNQFFEERYELKSKKYNINIEVDTNLDNNTLEDKAKYKIIYLLKDDRFKLSQLDIKFSGKQLYKLSKIIYNCLYESHPKLAIFVEYLKEINQLLYKLNLNNIWLSPSGILVEQRYISMDNLVKRYNFLGETRSITLKVPNKELKINLAKQVSSTMPNLTHTLDAANISLVINDFLDINSTGENINNNLKVVDIITIHDCFATQATNADLLNSEVKRGFIRLYINKDFLAEYHKFILNYITKSGYLLSEDNKNIIFDDDTTISIPNYPIFKYEDKFDFESSILKSSYFIN